MFEHMKGGTFPKCSYKKLPCFQVYGYDKITINFVRKHKFDINMWCEKYIDYIANIP
jgi:hypothetical protein